MELYELNGSATDDALIKIAQKWKPLIQPLDPDGLYEVELFLWQAENQGDIGAYIDLIESAVLIFRDLGNGYPAGLLDDARLFLAPNPDDNGPVQRGLAATLASIEAKQST
ncbi:hypothetical protein [Rothia nasimurium]|uniref:hypothetical protein n=1 Tax=Rothia nasimurium TaxID=85336 RepID=UPI001F380C55|nr:hypothetical protein [Rothia nasimurium]